MPETPDSAQPRVVVVTGASSGIGRATAHDRAAAGDHVVLLARDPASLEEAAAECRSAGAASATVLPTDVGDDEAVAGAIATVLEGHGRIDTVVHAAGVVAYGRTEVVPHEVFEGVVRTNLLGSVNVARHVVPVLRRQRSGTLLLVGSVIGHVAIPTMSPYVVSKWGVRALARQLAIENRDVPGVRIRYVAPGGVDTPIYDQAANYAGFAGRPPPPAASSARLAAQVSRRLGARRRTEQLALVNYPMIAAFQLLPRVYDAVIGTVFPLGATDLTKPVPEGPGNVLESHSGRNAVDGGHGSGVVGIVPNVATKLSSRRRPSGGEVQPSPTQ